MIEALARIICQDSSNRGKCETCGFRSCEDCNSFRAAKRLVDAGVTLQRWIPVSERLPEPMVDVVVYRPGMYYEYLVDHIYRDEFLRGRNIANMPCITHWLPIPEKPQEVSNGQT